MSFDLASFLGSSLGDAVAKIIGAFKVDPTAQLEAQTEVTKIMLGLQGQILQGVQAQVDVNKTEAASSSVFVAGWRPFLGWVCGSAFAINYVVGPLLGYCSTLAGHPIVLPTLNLGEMSPVLMGMLGLGTMRSVEKLQGVDTQKVGGK